MRFLNRFLIEEDIQFECAGVVEHEGYMERNMERNLVKSLERVSNESNSDFICHFVLSHDFIYFTANSFWNNLKNLTMITRIGSERLQCVQKEQYQNLYKEASNEGAEIKYDENTTSLVYKSVGDDIDDFYDRIIMNKINITDKSFLSDSEFCHNWARSFNLLQAPHSVKTFHLSLLSDKEERKMHSEITGIFDFKKKTKLSKKEKNYALSLGARKTLLFMSDAMNNKMHVWDVVEPDPWQERIKKNFEELTKQMDSRSLRLKKPSKTQEALEALEYYQTYCESDSSHSESSGSFYSIDNFDSSDNFD